MSTRPVLSMSHVGWERGCSPHLCGEFDNPEKEFPMRSAAAPTATVLIVVTLVFAPVMKHNRWYQMLVGTSTTKVEVACPATKRCAPVAAVVERVDATDASQRAIDAATEQSIQQGISDYLDRIGR